MQQSFLVFENFEEISPKTTPQVKIFTQLLAT